MAREDAGRIALRQQGSPMLGDVARTRSGVVSVDPPSIAAQDRGSVSVAILGVRAGDIVHMEPPDALEAGLSYSHCRVTGRDTVAVWLANLTGAPIDGVARSWGYTLSRSRGA